MVCTADSSFALLHPSRCPQDTAKLQGHTCWYSLQYCNQLDSNLSNLEATIKME